MKRLTVDYLIVCFCFAMLGYSMSNGTDIFTALLAGLTVPLAVFVGNQINKKEGGAA